MTSNVRMILDEVNARIKLAEAKTAEDPSNFDSFPGAENDKAVPAETKKPDPEVKDEGPASRTETTGAKPGSDAPVQQDHLYEADEPVLTPEKKPADSADANAKVASAEPANADVEKVASDILEMIRGKLEKQSGCCGGGGGSSTAKKPAATKAPAKKEAAPATPAKKEAADAINLSAKILDKIAECRLARKAGENDALSLIKSAMEYNRGANDAKALIQKIAQALEESANSADDAATCEGGACDVAPEAAGAADAEAALADAAAADAGDDQVTPEEVAQAVSELVDEGQISQEDAAALVSQISGDAAPDAGAAEVTDEQIAEGLAQAVESGEITEDEAQQIVQELVAAGADESVQADVANAAAEAAGADAGTAEAAAAAGDAVSAEEAAGAADAEAALADAQKTAEDDQIARYQKGFIQKCAEYGADPQKVAQYLQARISEQH